MPKPKGKCFAKNCEACEWWVDKPMEDMDSNNMPTGVSYMKKVCEFKVLFKYLHHLGGCFDGLQGAVNRAENTVVKFSRSCAEAFINIQENIDKIEKSKVVELKKIEGGAG